MIVTPEFVDHWKTRRLCDELEDPAAPLLTLRLWGHCQISKRWRFDGLSAGDLKAICGYSGAQERLWMAMQAAKFIRVEGQTVVVHQWEEYNSSLVTKWTNGQYGKLGGRPKGKVKKPANPKGGPRVRSENPKAPPIGLDRIGLENTNTGQPSLALGLPDEPAENPKASERAKDLIFEALAAFEGSKLSDITKDARGRINKAKSQLIPVRNGHTDEQFAAEIGRRGAELRRKMPDVTHTCLSLVAHWAEFPADAGCDHIVNLDAIVSKMAK